MNAFKRFLRLLLLALFIALASVSPVPILFYSKDNLPKNLIEKAENTEDEEDTDDIKTLS